MFWRRRSGVCRMENGVKRLKTRSGRKRVIRLSHWWGLLNVSTSICKKLTLKKYRVRGVLLKRSFLGPIRLAIFLIDMWCWRVLRFSRSSVMALLFSNRIKMILKPLWKWISCLSGVTGRKAFLQSWLTWLIYPSKKNHRLAPGLTPCSKWCVCMRERIHWNRNSKAWCRVNSRMQMTSTCLCMMRRRKFFNRNIRKQTKNVS